MQVTIHLMHGTPATADCVESSCDAAYVSMSDCRTMLEDAGECLPSMCLQAKQRKPYSRIYAAISALLTSFCVQQAAKRSGTSVRPPSRACAPGQPATRLLTASCKDSSWRWRDQLCTACLALLMCTAAVHILTLAVLFLVLCPPCCCTTCHTPPNGHKSKQKYGSICIFIQLRY